MVKKNTGKNGDFKIKEGVFTEQAKDANMTLTQFANYVVKNYKDNKAGKKVDYSPTLTTYRRAIFYKNSKKWKK